MKIIALLIFSDQIVLHLYFLPDTVFFLRKRLHLLKKEELQIVKEKMNYESFFFCERIAYCFAQLHIAQHDGKNWKKSLLHHRIL